MVQGDTLTDVITAIDLGVAHVTIVAMRRRPPWQILVLVPVGILIFIAFNHFRTTYMRHSVHRMLCAGNQRLLGERLLATMDARHSLWPIRQRGTLEGTGAAAHEATTIATLEALAAIAGLDPARVTCPANLGTALPPPLDPGVSEASGWVTTVTAHRTSMPGLAIDWEAPRGQAAHMILVADRDDTAHDDSIVVLYADLHTGSLSSDEQPPDAAHTRNRDDSPKHGAYRTPDGDDLYAPGGTWMR